MRIRAVIGKDCQYDGGSFVFAGAWGDGMWEIVPPEDWDKKAVEWQNEATGERQNYDWREVWVEIDDDDAEALFSPTTLKASVESPDA